MDKWSDAEIRGALSRLYQLARERSDPLSLRVQEIVQPEASEETTEAPVERLKQAISLMWPAAFPARGAPIDRVTGIFAKLTGVTISDIEMVDGDRRISFRGESYQSPITAAEDDLRELLDCLPESDSLQEESIDG